MPLTTELVTYEKQERWSHSSRNPWTIQLTRRASRWSLVVETRLVGAREMLEAALHGWRKVSSRTRLPRRSSKHKLFTLSTQKRRAGQTDALTEVGKWCGGLRAWRMWQADGGAGHGYPRGLCWRDPSPLAIVQSSCGYLNLQSPSGNPGKFVPV